MHQVERVIDVSQRHGVGDHVINVDLSLHVPVHNLWYIRATASTPKRGATPGPAGDELKRARGYFLTCACHPDNAALTPALMAAFQSLAHDVNVSDALEAVIDPAAGHLD